MENEEIITTGENAEEATTEAPTEATLEEPTEQAEEQAEETEEQAEEAENESLAVCEAKEEAVVLCDNPQVALIEERNEAVAVLRKRDCTMLTELRDHLGENIRLHSILDGINREIARLRELMKTPKPKIKTAMLVIGIILTLAGGGAFAALGSRGEAISGNITGILGGIIGLGVLFITLTIVLKVLGNKKWRAYMEELNRLLDIEKEKAEKAQRDIDNYWANSALPYISSIIPDRFPIAHVLDYNTVCGMLYIMENLRADTVKEAINLYDELSHRARVEASFSSMEASLYETARNSARYAAAAERSAEANERAAASAALTAASAASIASSAQRAASASEEASRAIQDSVNKN